LWMEPYYDLRGLQIAMGRDWSERLPLITFHGSLYKLNSPELLRCVFSILADDSRLEFVFMGKDDGRALEQIQQMAREIGVQARAHYEGVFDTLRSADGTVADPGWHKLLDYLGKSRLAIDPWPVSGGSSRLEAYACGCAGVSMRIRTDPASWRRPQVVASEVTGLHVWRASATTVEEYRAMCVSVLTDPVFARAVVSEQIEIARKMTDASRWWQDVRRCHMQWMATASAASISARTFSEVSSAG
jgi:hypothetical protein